LFGLIALAFLNDLKLHDPFYRLLQQLLLMMALPNQRAVQFGNFFSINMVVHCSHLSFYH